MGNNGSHRTYSIKMRFPNAIPKSAIDTISILSSDTQAYQTVGGDQRAYGIRTFQNSGSNLKLGGAPAFTKSSKETRADGNPYVYFNIKLQETANSTNIVMS